MSLASSLPVLGVALPHDGVKLHRDWIFDKNRDLELQDFFLAEVLNGDWRPLADAIKATLSGYSGRLGIHGPFWGLSIANMDPDIRRLVNKKMHQGLDVCAHLGATQMVIHSPYTTWDYNNLDNNPGSREGVIARAHETLKDVVSRAEDIGCQLVIENIEDKCPHIRVELAKSFNSKMVKVSIDTGHANYACHATSGSPVDYYVHAAGDALHHVHLQDTDGHADRHWAPGEGNICWHEVFRAIARLGSNPRLILELRNKEHVRQGADHLISLGLAQ